MVKKYIAAVVISQIFSNINRSADKACYSFTAAVSQESQRESSLEDNEGAKTKSYSDQTAKTGKDGNKMNHKCHVYGSNFHLFHILSCLY